ncbi:protein SMAX1-LIKE 3-like isoform X2 [Henckelia pumila]|uniref:protein SMAX1-LIKE 3-like isoform X2 n=1 Tax=Henckelia pumila TaxID=405737 RepID=UPI003C6E4D78
MRSGGYTLQQSLSPESAAVVKQAIGFARRRGHAQVTPLHVASTMLASSTCLLKRACLKSNSHPLQCRALELCFNVALNRLPTAVSSPLSNPHSHFPSLSNALIAAFKRAQAHQRRGSIENQQQQPILALKIEIEQLIISILDDPSISRVMREAGFSSTQVKINVEQAVSLEICRSKSPVLSCPSKEITKSLVLGNGLSLGRTENLAKNDDVTSVFEALMNKKTRNTVIVSECSSTAERIVRKVIDKFDRRDVPSGMKSVQFISVPLFTLQNISKQEFEVKLGELRSIVKAYVNTGAVLYLGNLDWVSEFWCNYREQSKGFYSCPVEYMMMELSRLINGVGENRRLWLMGVANFKTYAKCKSGHPSLETLWSLYPLTIQDSSSLALSLSLDGETYDRFSKEAVDDSKWLFHKAGVKKHLICCSDCSANFEREARGLTSTKQEFAAVSCSSNLPSWLQQYKNENKEQPSNDQECEKIKDLCKKWNSICTSVHRKPHFLEKVFDLASQSPSTSISSNDQNKSNLQKSLLDWPLIFEPNNAPIEPQILLHENETEVSKPCFRNYLTETKPDLLSNPNSSPNSASSSETSGDMELTHRFKEFNSENIKILCKTLKKNAPWQRDIIPEIANTVLKCRSGMMKSKKNMIKNRENREESWLLFLGVDSDGKETVARELARTIFGSYDSFNPIYLSNFTSTRADSSEEVSNNNKRARNEHGGSLFDRFLEGVRENPSRVFFLEDFDQMDHHSLKCFKRAIEDGFFTLPGSEEEVVFKDAIVIFSCESFSSASRACSPPIKERESEKKTEEECGLLDLNIATEEYILGENHSVSDNGILELVDEQFVFKIQVL